MYNKEQKERYIETRKNTLFNEPYLKNLFNKSIKAEEELEKDISNFSTNEILDFYKTLNATSIDSLATLNSQLSIYTQWCIVETLTENNQNGFAVLSMDILAGCINKVLLNKKIISRSTILKWCSLLPNAVDAFALIALFEVGKSKDYYILRNIDWKDIDQKNKTVQLKDGRVIEVSNEFIMYAERAYNEIEFSSVFGDGNRTYQWVENGHLLKDKPNVKNDVSEFQIGRRLYNQYTRILTLFGFDSWCNPNSIALSGRIWWINMKAKEHNTTAKDFLYHYEESASRFGKINKPGFYTQFVDYLV